MLLFHSALKAEEKDREEITLEDVEEAKRFLLDNLISYDLSKISEDKRKILESLLNSQYKTLNELSSLFPKKSERQVRNYLSELISMGYVVEESIKIGRTIKRIYRIKLKL